MPSSVTASCPAPRLELLTASGGNPVKIPTIPAHRQKTEGTNWLDATMVPSGTAGNIDMVNGTSSGWTSLVVEKWAAAPLPSAFFMLLTGRIKPGATTSLVNNLITVSINSVEVGRLYVSAATQKIGWFGFQLPEGRSDTRFALSGTGTTGDLLFALTAADPALELRLIILGDD